jgi:hypothetical protein
MISLDSITRERKKRTAIYDYNKNPWPQGPNIDSSALNPIEHLTTLVFNVIRPVRERQHN